MDTTQITTLVNYGVLGIIFVLWLTGWLHPKGEIRDKDAIIAELKEAVKLERQRADTAIEVSKAQLKLMEAFKEIVRSGDSK